MTRKIIVWVRVGREKEEATIEIEGDLSDEQIDEIASDAIGSMVDSGWIYAEEAK